MPQHIDVGLLHGLAREASGGPQDGRPSPPEMRSATIVPGAFAVPGPPPGRPPPFGTLPAVHQHVGGAPPQQPARPQHTPAPVHLQPAQHLQPLVQHHPDRMTAALEALAMQASATNALLLRSSGGGSEEDPVLNLLGRGNVDIDMNSSKSGGARGLASIEWLRQDFLKHPGKVTKIVTHNAMRELSLVPGQQQTPNNVFTAYFAEHVPMDRMKTFAYMTFGMAAVMDLLMADKVEAAKDQMSLLLSASEQAAHDGGRWQVAWLLTHLPEPPWTRISFPPRADAVRPYARLPDPGWIAASVAFTKDVAALAEARKKLGGKGGGKSKDKEKAADD
jgi:hypothetical protein